MSQRSNWNTFHEDLLSTWSSTSKTYNIMHTIASEYYHKIDNYLNFPLILLGALTTSSIFATVPASFSNYSHMWTYINGGLTLTMTILSGFSKSFGINEKIVKHSSTAFKYTQIAMDIDSILSEPSQDRKVSPTMFIEKMKKEILDTRKYSPNIPSDILNKFIQKLDKNLVNVKTTANTKNNIQKRNFLNIKEPDPNIENKNFVLRFNPKIEVITDKLSN